MASTSTSTFTQDNDFGEYSIYLIYFNACAVKERLERSVRAEMEADMAETFSKILRLTLRIEKPETDQDSCTKTQATSYIDVPSTCLCNGTRADSALQFVPSQLPSKNPKADLVHWKTGIVCPRPQKAQEMVDLRLLDSYGHSIL